MRLRHTASAAVLSAFALVALAGCARPEPIRTLEHLDISGSTATLRIDELLPDDASGFLHVCSYSSVDGLAEASGIDRGKFTVHDRDLPSQHHDGGEALLPIIDGEVRRGAEVDPRGAWMCGGLEFAAVLERGSTVHFELDEYGELNAEYVTR